MWRGSVLIGWFFAVMFGQNGLVLGLFETHVQCALAVQEVNQLLSQKLVIRASSATQCWEG